MFIKLATNLAATVWSEDSGDTVYCYYFVHATRLATIAVTPDTA